ncbi:MAG TPA: hypothetical protein VH092_16615 [Urbifossiella sp.]|nr:hypothetical protein [Urbifossiella sp.]
MDYDLDDRKGSEVVAFLQQIELRPRVIAVSAHADGNAALLAAGADAACPKMRFAGIETALRSAMPGSTPRPGRS